jgi:hypothetical protein
MPAVHWACIVCILLSLFFTSRMSRQIG